MWIMFHIFNTGKKSLIIQLINRIFKKEPVIYWIPGDQIRMRFVMTIVKNKARIPKQQRGIESKEKIIKAAMVLFA